MTFIEWHGAVLDDPWENVEERELAEEELKEKSETEKEEFDFLSSDGDDLPSLSQKISSPKFGVLIATQSALQTIGDFGSNIPLFLLHCSLKIPTL